MMARRIKHSSIYVETERIWSYRSIGSEEYQRKEQLRVLDVGKRTYRVVYDNSDKSPYYTDPNSPYLDEKKLLPVKEDAPHQKSRVQPRGFRRAVINSGIPRKDKVYIDLNPFYKLSGPEDKTLVFESRFEWGSLKRVIQVEDFEYDWIMQSDYNSQGWCQWFYFQIKNTRADKKYTFNLYNFYKPDSLYNQGMRLLMYSSKKANLESVGWMRWGSDICYYQNWNKRKSGEGALFTLSFTIEFPYDNDEVYLSHWFPYTYRDCKDHLNSICNDNRKGSRKLIFRGKNKYEGKS